MRQVEEFSDERNKGFCVHCGGPYQTDDHMPSRVFLDKPYPDNLSVSPSCSACNNYFSSHEEYLACVLECIVCNSTDPHKLERSKISNRLERSPKLAAMIGQIRHIEDGQILWDVDQERVKIVMVKLARGHASFELAEPQTGEPDEYFCKPLCVLTSDELAVFENEPEASYTAWPEVGSRAMSRLLILKDAVYDEGWLLVQEGRYRFRALLENGVTIQIIIRDYLACQIVWTD
jgi:hypothetical protein